MKMPLEDVMVLDLSHALAGPHCSTMLADFGAHVIKLETPGAGDIARAWGAPLPGGENSYFVGLHRNKRGISIDLKTAEGKAELNRRIDKAARSACGLDQAVTTGSRIRPHAQTACYRNAMRQIEPQFARLVDSNSEGA